MHRLSLLLLTAVYFLRCRSNENAQGHQQQKQYCVCSNENSSSMMICHQCRQLEQYQSDNDLTLDDSLFIFYPGTHNLTKPWTLSGIRNITFAGMEGEGAVTIRCMSENAGLQFINVSFLTIRGLDIFQCGVSADIDDHRVKSALIFLGGDNLELQSLKVSSSFVAGISIHDVQGSVIVNRSLFTDANFSGVYNSYEEGNSIIYSHFGEVTVNITHTRFEGNRYKMDSHNKSDPRLSAGLSIIVSISNVNISLFNVTLKNNSGHAGGNLAIFFKNTHELVNSTSVTIDNSIITGGYSNLGGGAFVSLVNSQERNSEDCVNKKPLLAIRNSTISYNTVDYVGGGIYLRKQETNESSNPGSVTIEGCNFIGNRVTERGNGGIALHYTTYVVKGFEHRSKSKLEVHVSYCNFSEHSAENSSVKLGNAVILVRTSPYFSVANTTIANNTCTGLLAITSNVIISGDVTISHNHAVNGGGMLLCSGGFLYLARHTNLSIIGNTAEHTGGGINIESECIINKPRCFFQFNSEFNNNESINSTIRVTVSDNKANYSGDNIYGGSVSNCYIIDLRRDGIFKEVFNVPGNSLTNGALNSSIASSPSEVCLFHHITRRRECPYSNSSKVEIYPGEKFSIDAIIVGQQFGLVPGAVYAKLDSKGQYLEKSNELQKVESTEFKKLSYTVYSEEENVNVTLHLTAEEASANPHSKKLEIPIKIKKCPVGYTLQTKYHQCSCDTMKKHTNGINICSIREKAQIEYESPLWIGLVQTSSNDPTIALSNVCPRDYCILGITNLTLTNLTVNSSVQCYFNHSGVLCGGCSEGFSLILGSSECRAGCTNYHLSLVLVFALAGVLLVFVITFLNLTVSSGTINGLIFHANIIQIYAALMFEKNNHFIASFLRIFLAWLNLDFGFKTCFYRGMDALTKALLQFVFPVYIWIIAGTIIFLGRRYSIVMKVFGEKSVQVLATLILLSYTKIIRATMDALHYTTIIYLVDDEPVTFFHWSLDGQLRYWKGGHVAVFAVGVIFALTSLPLMLTLLLIKHIGRFSNWPFCSWIHKLKPLFDSYTGPCTDKGRFWIGLLLLARVFILGIYAFNKVTSDIMIMAVTVLLCLVLLFIAMVLPKGIYKRHRLNVLECFFLVNLGLLFLVAICCMYYKQTKARVYAVNISVGTSFVVFVSLFVYHVLAKLKYLGRLTRLIESRFHKRGNNNAMECSHQFGLTREEDPLLDTRLTRK